MKFWGAVRALLTLALATSILTACGTTGTGPKEVTFWADATDGPAYERSAAECNANSTDFKITVHFMQPNYEDNHQILLRELTIHSSDVDIYTVDATWMTQFAQGHWMQPWTGTDAAHISASVAPSVADGATVNGKIYAAPVTAQTEAVVYQPHFVTAPQTWNDAVSNGRFGMDVPGRADVSNLFTTLVASAGGDLHNEQALDTAATFLHDYGNNASAYVDPKSKPPAMANQPGAMAEVINPQTFYRTSRGDSSAPPPVISWAGLPAFPGQTVHAAVQQTNIAVASFSNKKTAAFAAARCLTSQSTQAQNLEHFVFPADTSVYDLPGVHGGPMDQIDALEKEQLANSIAMPKYENFEGAAVAIENSILPFANIQTASFGSRVRDAIDAAGNRNLH